MTNEQKPNIILEFISGHKVVFGLLLIIVIILIYFMIKINSLENEFTEKTDNMKKDFELQIDSMKIANLQQTIKVFSWAVRSEMNRNNLEQVEQFFSNFVKENDIRMIDLINPENAKIILSTDKKNEGRVVTDAQILEVDQLKLLGDSRRIQVVVPVMGLDKKIGILVVEVIK